MLTEWWVKYLSPQNTFGVSGLNSAAAKSNRIEVKGAPSSDGNKMAPYCSCGVIQVSASHDIHIWLETV